MTESISQPQTMNVDVVIFGGGVAGLWTLNRLSQLGFNTVLLESARLGEGQTRYAQGIIHGGTKYALTGKLTASSEAIRAMPKRWQDCLAGQGEINLSDVAVLSEHQYMWSTGSLSSRLSGFFASKVMKSRTQSLDSTQRPGVFQNEQFHGHVYQLDEVVLDTATIIRALSELQKHRIYKLNLDSLQLEKKDDSVSICWKDNATTHVLSAKIVVLCAGAGNEELLARLKQATPRMQRRPLHMVAIRGMEQALYAHCLGASTVPRITITSHPDEKGGWVWYLGGQLAEEGINRSAEDQLKIAHKEMSELFPWLNLDKKQWASLRIDRAEPYQPDGKRPDTAFVEQQGSIITAWPTKMAFAPLLSDEVIRLIQDNDIRPAGGKEFDIDEFPGYAELPWQEPELWD